MNTKMKMNKYQEELKNWNEAGKISKTAKLDVVFKLFGQCMFQAQKMEKQLILMLASHFKYKKRKLDVEIDRLINGLKNKRLTLGELLKKEIRINFDLTNNDYNLVDDTIKHRNNLVHNYFDNKISLLESEEGQLTILKSLSEFYDKSESSIDKLKIYYKSYVSKYSIDSFEIEKVYRNFLTNIEKDLGTKLLLLESEFFKENEELFKPDESDFRGWLRTIPDFFAQEFESRGLYKCKDTRDFMYYYFNENGVSFEEYMKKRKISEEVSEFWKIKLKDRNEKQEELSQNPLAKELFKNFNNGWDNMMNNQN